MSHSLQLAHVQHARLRPLPGEVRHPRFEPIPLGDRLWPKVAGDWLPGVTRADCWLWLGASRTGRYRVVEGRRVVAEVPYDYGRIHAPTADRPKRILGAHVATYEVIYGPVPAGKVVGHRCDVGLCCNPDHLEALTPAENTAAMLARGRHRRPRAVA